MTHPYTVPSESSFALHRETERLLPLVLINHCVHNECRCRDLATTAVITLPIPVVSYSHALHLLYYYFIILLFKAGFARGPAGRSTRPHRRACGLLPPPSTPSTTICERSNVLDTHSTSAGRAPSAFMIPSRMSEPRDSERSRVVNPKPDIGPGMVHAASLGTMPLYCCLAVSTYWILPWGGSTVCPVHQLDTIMTSDFGVIKYINTS